MNNLENIRFQKINITKFSQKEKMDLVKELKKRKISHRLTETAILFDERYLQKVKDLIPPKFR